MATAARPQSNVTTAAPASAMVLYNKQELAAFTNADAKALLQPMLPAGVSYEVVLSELYFAIQKNPEIAKCEVPSMLMAVQRCLSWGLTIGETAHLVPFKGKLTAVRDYKGDVALVVRAGGAKSIDAYVVWDDEAFDYGLGDSPFVKHRPALKRKAGAKIIAAYAVAHIGINLPPKIVIMGVDEIDEIRKAKSKSWNVETYWENNTKKQRAIPIEKIPWYCEKTVVHRIVKQLPTASTSVELQAVATQLEEEIVSNAEIEDAPATEAVVEHDVSHMVEEEEPAGEQPKCPVCAGPMIDRRLTKQNLQSPDYVCQDQVCAKEKKGVYWPGEWPPKPPATDEQRAEIGRLTAELAKLGGNARSINSANAKNADPAFKTHHADALIKKLAGFVTEAAKAKPAAPAGDYNTKDSSPETQGKF